MRGLLLTHGPAPGPPAGSSTDRGLRWPQAMVLLAVLGAVLLVAGPAAAHGDLVYGSPGPGDYVAPGVTVLRLEMSTVKKDAPVYIAILDAKDDPLWVGSAAVVWGGDDKVVCAQVEPMEPGVHAVEYTAIATDGHRLGGRYLFEVAKTATEPTDRVEPGACAGADLGEPGEAQTPGRDELRQ